MTAREWTDFALLGAVALLVYSVLVWLALLYSRRVNWVPPVAANAAEWNKRRNLGLALGAAAVLVCALSSVIWSFEWPRRIMMVGQATLLAAAGTSDLRHFHLPLPFTLTGIAAALATVYVTGVAWPILAFALFWAALSIVLHALVSKRSMQLGDYIATVWIALLLPFNGLLAMLAGDVANVAIVRMLRMRGLRSTKVAAAGAWLVFAAALVNIPPYMTWLPSDAGIRFAPEHGSEAFFTASTVVYPVTESAGGNSSVSSDLMPQDGAATPLLQTTPVVSQSQTFSAVTASALITISEWAGDHTARVALANDHAGRVSAAKRESVTVGQYAAFARQIAPDSDVAKFLSDLTSALGNYDVDGVRSASLSLAQEREHLAQFITQSNQTHMP